MAFPRIETGIARDERLPATLLIMFFGALCIAGGASREDVVAQSVIRGAAVLAMLTQIVFGRIPQIGRYPACSFLLGGMIAIAGLQLVPLPPAMWTSLPGRAIIVTSPLGSNGWRPLNLVPDAGWNALFSLLVPLSTLLLLSALSIKSVSRAKYLLIAATIFSALLALLQAAAIAPENPLINGSAIDYAGIFANRNHQAVFLAIGILVSWFWGAQGGRSWRSRRQWLSICIIVLLFVSILVAGSRAGALLGAIATVFGPLFTLSRRRARGSRRHVLVFWPVAALVIVGGATALSVYFGRALSLDRATSLTLDSEFRLRSLATVWAVAKTYFPFGAGLGSFDNVFRIAEPFSLLEPTYFNHAHNDFLEIIIETGIFGLVLLLGALIWGARRFIASLFQDGAAERTSRLGGLIMILVIIASVSDYPARTPMLMATVMLAACWLTDGSRDARDRAAAGALPPESNAL